MLLAVPMGRLIDRIGVRKPLMVGCLCASAGVMLAAIVPGLSVLYLSAILIGTGFIGTPALLPADARVPYATAGA